ncbi:MAG TPA: ferritin family protein [Burkholderiaceae bacterium]|nr:ferritin family protein [Burkholderiaceae bacterium]HYB51521.1 ferritin family protein [Burkholderiaceae bacterium]
MQEGPINNVERFLAHAVRLEREAARRYEELAAAMQTHGNRELMQFFGRMAHYSRMHLKEAVARTGFRDVPQLGQDEYEWPEGVAPETVPWAGVDALMDPRVALELALDSERRGLAYYKSIALITSDAELRALASSFAAEEAQHVAALEKLLAPRCR